VKSTSRCTPAVQRRPTDPLQLALPGRTLLLVAGLPGAGKSTLLTSMPRTPGVVVLDSDSRRATLARLLPGVPYRWYRGVVHLWHRLAILAAAASGAPTVVVHLPATAVTTRVAVARLAALTGRAAHLLWLDVDAVEARRAQQVRGRILTPRSFAQHAENAATTAAELRAGRHAEGWCSVTVLDRAAARQGLRLET
jgi:predicted kinase